MYNKQYKYSCNPNFQNKSLVTSPCGHKTFELILERRSIKTSISNKYSILIEPFWSTCKKTLESFITLRPDNDDNSLLL